MCPSVCPCVCVNVSACAYTCASVRVSMRVRVCLSVCVLPCVSACACILVHVRPSACLYACVYSYACASAGVSLRVRVCLCVGVGVTERRDTMPITRDSSYISPTPHSRGSNNHNQRINIFIKRSSIHSQFASLLPGPSPCLLSFLPFSFRFVCLVSCVLVFCFSFFLFLVWLFLSFVCVLSLSF